MKSVIKFSAPVVVLAIGLGIYSLLHATKPQPEKKTEPPRPVSVFVNPVTEADMNLTVSTAGEVRARTHVDLVAQVGGRIVSVSPEFVEGGKVAPGAALVTIEDTDYRLALAQARVQVAKAQTALEEVLATADVARKQLQGTSAATDLALKRPQVAGARAELDAANAALEQAKLNLQRTHISLPFKGRITDKNVGIGQYVTPGTKLGSAFATDKVEVRLPLRDEQLASLGVPLGYIAEEGGGPSVDFSANVGGHTQHWTGHLVRIDASIDKSTSEIYGIAEVDSPYDENVSQLGMPLAVGLFVNAEINGRHVDNAMVIPRDALRAGNKVYVVKDGTLDIRDVEVSHSDRHSAVLSSGVHPGDQVVVSSIRNPISGMALEALHSNPDSSSIADSNDTGVVGG